MLLKDCIEIKNGKDYSHLNKGNIPVYGTGGVFKYVDQYLYDSSALLLPRKGTLNNIMYVENQKFWTVDTMFYAICKNTNVNLKYLYYYLTLIDIEKFDIGSTVPSMTTSLYYQIDIPLPERKIQDKIVSILSNLDKQIERNNAMTKKLQVLIRTKYCTMFENKNTPNGFIKDICLLHSGFSFKPEMYCNNGKYKLVTIKNVNEIFVNTDKTDKLSATPNGMKEYCKLSVGDIVMSLTGNVGRISIVTEENNLLNQRVALLKCDEEYTTYIYALLNSQKYQIIMQKISRGTSQKNLSPIDVENLEIFIPNNIKEFYNETILYFNQMIKIQQNTQHLHSLKDKILPLLINNQLTV